jgi:NAD(P)-dependent dehydrogenase (short-subunit alcohol dehydrogenase family)
MWALVTGATRSIGQAIIKDLLEAYPTIQIVAVGKEIVESKVLGAFQSDRIIGFNCDVASFSEIRQLGLFMTDKPLTFLFNISEYVDYSSVSTVDPFAFDQATNSNVKAPLFLVQRLRFVANARICNLGSGTMLDYDPC